MSWKRKDAGNGNIGADKGSVAEPERIKTQGATGQAGTIHQNGILAQILYISAELDKQSLEIQETGRFNAKIILDMRFRLGEVLRGSI